MIRKILGMLALFLLMVLNGTAQPQKSRKYIVDVQAHRGGMGLYPEESLEAMINAVNLGVNTLEMDLGITKDRKVVLSHEKYFTHHTATHPDGTLVQKGDPKEYIWHMPYDSVAKYDVGFRRHPEMPEQQLIPTPKRLLEDVVATVEAYTKRNHLEPMNYNIEIKSEGDSNGGIEGRDWPEYHEFVDICMSALDTLNLGDRLIIQSFDTRALNYINEAYPGHHLAYLIGGRSGTYDEFMGRLNFTPEWFSPAWTVLNKEMVDRAHADGMKIVTWTVDEKDQMRSVINIGVEAVITNYPNRLLEVVAEY